MYQPRVFREEERTRIHALIDSHSFGTFIVSPPSGELEIAHVPFLLDRTAGKHGRLSLHVARANPIDLTALEGKFKLSQNRSDTDCARVVEALRTRGSSDDLELVALMTQDE